MHYCKDFNFGKIDSKCSHFGTILFSRHHLLGCFNKKKKNSVLLGKQIQCDIKGLVSLHHLS